MRDVVIVGGRRTAIGNFGGALKDIPVSDLGAIVIKDLLKRLNLRPIPSEEMIEVCPKLLKGKGITELEKKYGEWDKNATPVPIDEVIMGNVLQGGQGQNTARQAAIYAGIPKETPCVTINKVCGSGLKAIEIGYRFITSGMADVVIAGGFENMSQAPFALPKARWGYRMEVSSKGDIIDLMVWDGLYEIFYGYHMGVTAENLVELYKISRREQDEVALLSHQRAIRAIKEGIFKEEIVPVKIKTKKGEAIFDTDERPRETSIEKLGKLPPVFKENGTVTAGNASGINDAASAVLLMSADKARELGLEPIIKIKGFASAGGDPAYMGLGAAIAAKKLLRRMNMKIEDVDLIELNEAFAAQTIACLRELGITYDRINELGSGISLGHPIGCTGARIVVTGMYQMKRKGYKMGLFCLCIGGGMGMAMMAELWE